RSETDNGIASCARTASANRETSAWTCSWVSVCSLVRSIRLINVRCRRDFISWNDCWPDPSATAPGALLLPINLSRSAIVFVHLRGCRLDLLHRGLKFQIRLD